MVDNYLAYVAVLGEMRATDRTLLRTLCQEISAAAISPTSEEAGACSAMGDQPLDGETALQDTANPKDNPPPCQPFLVI